MESTPPLAPRRIERLPPRVAEQIAAGEVIEDHPLRECKDPVDCEVR